MTEELILYTVGDPLPKDRLDVMAAEPAQCSTRNHKIRCPAYAVTLVVAPIDGSGERYRRWGACRDHTDGLLDLMRAGGAVFPDDGDADEVEQVVFVETGDEALGT